MNKHRVRGLEFPHSGRLGVPERENSTSPTVTRVSVDFNKVVGTEVTQVP